MPPLDLQAALDGANESEHQLQAITDTIPTLVGPPVPMGRGIPESAMAGLHGVLGD